MVRTRNGSVTQSKKGQTWNILTQTLNTWFSIVANWKDNPTQPNPTQPEHGCPFMSFTFFVRLLAGNTWDSEDNLMWERCWQGFEQTDVDGEVPRNKLQQYIVAIFQAEGSREERMSLKASVSWKPGGEAALGEIGDGGTPAQVWWERFSPHRMIPCQTLPGSVSLRNLKQENPADAVHSYVGRNIERCRGGQGTPRVTRGESPARYFLQYLS